MVERGKPGMAGTGSRDSARAFTAEDAGVATEKRALDLVTVVTLAAPECGPPR